MEGGRIDGSRYCRLTELLGHFLFCHLGRGRGYCDNNIDREWVKGVNDREGAT